MCAGQYVGCLSLTYRKIANSVGVNQSCLQCCSKVCTSMQLLYMFSFSAKHTDTLYIYCQICIAVIIRDSPLQ
jgi:hypothetical protein